MKTIVFLLDETGSMLDDKVETIQAFNGYLDGLRKEEALFYLTLFNSEKTEQRHVGTPVAEVTPLDDETYQPHAMTPLLDAIAKTIVPMIVEAMMVVLTDGMENASHEYSLDGVKALISEKEKAGWKFIFLGAGPDAFGVAQAGVTMGMQAAQVTPTSSSSHAMRTASFASADYLSGRTVQSAVSYAAKAAEDEAKNA